MKSTSLLIAAVLVVAVALSACGPVAVAAQAQPPQRTLVVNGTGMVMMTPDIAYINIGVHTEEATAADAVSKNNAQTQLVVNALTAAGVDKKDVQTQNFSIYPSSTYDPQTSQKTGTTYIVDNTVYVTVRSLDKLGDLLDAAVKAGANSVNSIQFDVADKSEALKQARDQAVKDAKAQAQELSAAADLKLGEIQTISFYDNIPAPMASGFGKGGGGEAMAAPASVPISSGQMTLTVTVNMTYEIK